MLIHRRYSYKIAKASRCKIAFEHREASHVRILEFNIYESVNFYAFMRDMKEKKYRKEGKEKYVK